MNRDYKLYIDDIKKSIARIEEYMKGISEEAFGKDEKLQDAVIRRFEIIGEATKNISGSLKEKNKQVPWRIMSQLRDLVMHGYFEVGIGRVWRAFKDHLPQIKEGMKNINLV